MAIDQKLEEHWQKAMRAPENKPKDKLERLLEAAGIAPNEGDVLSDPLFLEVGQAERRKHIMSQMEAYETATAPSGLGADYITDVDGTQYHGTSFYLWQSQTAHALLTRGMDPRTVAVAVFRPVGTDGQGAA